MSYLQLRHAPPPLPSTSTSSPQEFTQAVQLVPCESNEAGIYSYDPDTGRIKLVNTNSEQSAPVRAEPGVGPGEGENPGNVAAAPDLSVQPVHVSFSPTAAPTSYSLNPPATAAAARAAADHEEEEPSTCLAVLGASLDDGAVLTLKPCVTVATAAAAEDGGSNASAYAFEFEKWGVGVGPGSVMVRKTGQCVTAGWPFFTGVAFKMNDDLRDRYHSHYAVVVLNEAEEPVQFDLSFPDEEFAVSSLISPRSIQTIVV